MYMSTAHVVARTGMLLIHNHVLLITITIAKFVAVHGVMIAILSIGWVQQQGHDHLESAYSLQYRLHRLALRRRYPPISVIYHTGNIITGIAGCCASVVLHCVLVSPRLFEAPSCSLLGHCVTRLLASLLHLCCTLVNSWHACESLEV